MGLHCNVRKQLPDFDLRLEFSVAPGTLTALVGPSGAGKSTLLRLIAGLDTPDGGTITLGGRCLFDKITNQDVPTRKRRIGFVFQDYPLFQHLSIFHNIAFSCRETSVITNLMDRFGIAHLAQRKPGQISGGQRQRAALCQTLASNPAILLLDEPFSALDATTRNDLRSELLHLTRSLNIPVLLVTHDLNEAVQLGDNIIPICDGHLAPEWLHGALSAVRSQDLTLTSNRICA